MTRKKERHGMCYSAEFVTKKDAYLITTLVNHLPAIIAALRQPRGDDESVGRVADQHVCGPGCADPY